MENVSDLMNHPSDEQRLKERITNLIGDMFSDEEYGFQIYVVMKPDFTLKRLNLWEAGQKDNHDLEKNFKRKIQVSLKETIIEKFITSEKEYDFVKNVADNQKKFYVILQDEYYKPFEITKTPVEKLENLSAYHASERENAQGIFFRFVRSSTKTVIWAYQFFYPNAIPNRKGISIIPSGNGDVFEELKKPLLVLSRRVDVLVIDDEIIFDNIDFMQRHFAFQEFVKSTARKVVNDIEALGLVSQAQKLLDYIEHSKLSYAKKMLRLKDSRVLQKSATDIYQKVTTLPRWKAKFDLDKENQKIVLNTYQQVENLIDLLDERYTRSEVTDEEYDSGNGVKKWVAPILKNKINL